MLLRLEEQIHSLRNIINFIEYQWRKLKVRVLVPQEKLG